DYYCCSHTTRSTFLF
nr:immunoglobulin light chain junction region [Macaca mulatta]